jgi:hypothetical protein
MGSIEPMQPFPPKPSAELGSVSHDETNFAKHDTLIVKQDWNNLGVGINREGKPCCL